MRDNKLKASKRTSKFDPLGSYTGIAEDNLTPTQDADDL